MHANSVSMGELIVMLIMGYLIGSCNFAIIFSKLFKKEDIRQKGSGNAGATNVLRNYGKAPAALVFVLDLLKGVAAVALARLFYPNFEVCACVAAFGAILGHNFPCYYDFRGGKGVATSFATLLVISWKAALIALAVFLVAVLITRYVSVGSILASVAAPTAAIVMKSSLAVCVFTVCVGLLCVIRHKSNIIRLVHGKENKLGKKQPKQK